MVGGHCIGVDPHYLTYKAKMLGYLPQVILAVRRINDGMGAYVAQQTIKQLALAGHNIGKCTVSDLGLTFKENCPDLRNSKVIDVIGELESYGVTVQVHDPEADTHEAQEEYVQLDSLEDLEKAKAMVIAVAHKQFLQFSGAHYQSLLGLNAFVMDVKGKCKPAEFAGSGTKLWHL